MWGGVGWGGVCNTHCVTCDSVCGVGVGWGLQGRLCYMCCLWGWGVGGGLQHIPCYMRSIVFNLTQNVILKFKIGLYGVRHMVKDHSDSEKGNPLPPHRLLLSINSKGSFICTIPQTG